MRTSDPDISLLKGSEDERASGILSKRLVELQEEAEMPLAREIIAAISTSPTAAAMAALKETAEKSRRLRKGRHSSIRALAQKALDSIEARGGG